MVKKSWFIPKKVQEMFLGAHAWNILYFIANQTFKYIGQVKSLYKQQIEHFCTVTPKILNKIPHGFRSFFSVLGSYVCY